MLKICVGVLFHTRNLTVGFIFDILQVLTFFFGHPGVQWGSKGSKIAHLLINKLKICIWMLFHTRNLKAAIIINILEVLPLFRAPEGDGHILTILTPIWPLGTPNLIKTWSKSKINTTVKFLVWNNVSLQILRFCLLFVGYGHFFTIFTPVWPLGCPKKGENLNYVENECHH